VMKNRQKVFDSAQVQSEPLGMTYNLRIS
jgi:hypothetical protein